MLTFQYTTTCSSICYTLITIYGRVKNSPLSPTVASVKCKNQKAKRIFQPTPGETFLGLTGTKLSQELCA